MSLKECNIKKEYRIPQDNIISDFYIPLLRVSKQYDRSVGYFSSDALVQLSYGICDFVKNGGKIRIIASPNLSKDDFDAINRGYIARDKIIENALLKELYIYNNYFKEERLSLISELIARNILDIKIAFSVQNGAIGLYHEKMGIFYDDSDIVSFSGSMNETFKGMTENYEAIDVFKSWEDEERTNNKRTAFEKIWNNLDNCAISYEFPKIVKDKLLSYRKGSINYHLDKEEQNEIIKQFDELRKKTPYIPTYYDIRSYQKDAIQNWKTNNYVGIFDMATGTGKTITAITALVEFLENYNMHAGIVICVPYQHLVDQWYDELKNFNFKPIMGYSTSPQKRWKERFKRELREYSLNLRNIFCCVLTNNTFAGSFVQDLIRDCRKKLVLVVDEAHNFGSPSLVKLLDKNKFQYRLALSATFERNNDEEGTNHLYNFFETKCIEYTMKQAIDEHMLTRYYYHPVCVFLDEDELKNYNELSYKIKKALKYNEDGTEKLTEVAKALLIKRSRIVAGARNKINVLKDIMMKHKKEKQMLIYCGATNYYNSSDENYVDYDEIKQITKVQQMLNHELDMTVLQFTSNETTEERKEIIDNFKYGRSCQAIVAIKCLDEGVNIPNIKTAFILASSTNPKEYIQRRGRVLRKSKEKDFSVIYDFITLPRNLNEIKETDDIDYDMSLVKREVSRIIEFADLSDNSRESYELIDRLYKIYGYEITEGKEGVL